MTLQTPLTQGERIFKMYAGRLSKLDIYTFEDLLYHLPFRYDDFSLISKIGQVQPGETITIRGEVLEIENAYTRNHKNIQKALVADETGTIDVVWYRQPFLTQVIKPHSNVSLSGKISFFNRKVVLTSPDYEILEEDKQSLHTGRLVPVYPETKGVTSKWFRRYIHALLLEFQPQLTEYLPEKIRMKYGYMGLFDALKTVHFPESLDDAIRARGRLGFDEMLLMQIKARERKAEWEKDLKGNAFQVDTYKKELDLFTTALPFTLTDSQAKSVHEIFADVQHDKPMNRLLQGDVGSGKTVVGANIMYLAFLNGFQSVLMAPTEILALQHYETIKKFLEPLGLRIALATGSKKSPDIKTTTDSFDILVGTHAVLSEKIQFKNLGLVIIDEQQRFGVEQRSIIREKGNNPHFLTMTATPIPRTVALTMYGDLDISYLSELPKGRKQIKTWLVPNEKRDGSYDWIRKQVKELDSQIFIICPFIEESENMLTIKAAKVEFERLKMYVFPDLSLGMLHGKLKAKEKDQVLDDFRNKTYDILVATPVVEVGIDIPNATVIVIEAAERFGLAQLHQLRGRVGRGEKQSYCLLFTENANEKTTTRLKAMETTHNGAALAELDLKLRGPGDIFGTAQSGLPKLKVASFSDFTLIERSKHEAKDLYEHLTEYPELFEKVQEITIAKVSPD